MKDKIGVIDHLFDKVDNLIIGGGLSYTFSKAQGYEIGNSLLEEDKIDLAKSLFKRRKTKALTCICRSMRLLQTSFQKMRIRKSLKIDAIPEVGKVSILGQKRLNCMQKSL